MRNNRRSKIFALLLSAVLAVGMMGLTGCMSGDGSGSSAGQSISQSAASSASSSASSSGSDAQSESGVQVKESGTYDGRAEVALYLHRYGHLPDNYITKKEARALGWSGGSVEEYAEGKCIGGDRFGNYEGTLPEDDSYRECDIDTLGKSSRGAKRIIFSDDGDIYYTGDHYEHFQQLYDADGPVSQ